MERERDGERERATLCERERDCVCVSVCVVCVCVRVCVCVCSSVLHNNRCYYLWKQAFVSRLMDTSWIGLSDREKEGTHKWVDGTPMTSR